MAHFSARCFSYDSDRTGAGAEGLTGALLAQAFRGALVAQGPADEAARVLLERVRTAANHQDSAP